jgi:hypothetical protein
VIDNFEDFLRWWAMQVSNLRPLQCEGRDLIFPEISLDPVFILKTRFSVSDSP